MTGLKNNRYWLSKKMTMNEDKPKIPLWTCEGKREMTYWTKIIGVNA